MDSAIVLNWVLTSASLSAIIAIGIWVGKISERVRMLREKTDAFDKTREDVIRMLTILEQSHIGELNERLMRLENAVRQVAKKEGVDF
jgi:hypothetical protein